MQRLTTLRTRQVAEIEKLSDTIDKVITPDQVIPKNIHDYPRCLELCERMRQICKRRAEELENVISSICDPLAKDIEEEKYVHKITTSGLRQYRKKYPNAESRERELRMRLAVHETYPTLAAEKTDWELMRSDWRTHHDRLRRELSILESDYLHNGASTISIHTEK